MIRTVLALVVAVGASASIARGDIITVPGDFPTIQGAINAAVDGDEVVVAAGTYFESINFNGKAITVRSTGGAGVTTIDGSGLGTSVVKAINAEGAGTVLRGFRIRAGVGILDDDDTALGGGMVIIGASPVVLECSFTENAADFGGGLYSSGGSPLIDTCDFVLNLANSGGGGAWCSGGSAVIVGSFFANNRSTLGGGLGLPGGTPRVAGTFFASNEATDGCGLYARNGTPLVESCGFFENLGIHGGGLLFSNIGDAKANPPMVGIVRDCVFVLNMTENRGGGAHISNSVAAVGSCHFHGNSTRGFGGGLWSFNSDLSVINGVFSGNSAVLGGGFGADNEGHVFIHNSSFGGNSAFIGGGMHATAAVPLLVFNTISWGNAGSALVSPHPDTVVENSNIEGGFAGAGNIDADPNYVDLDGADNMVGTLDDDLRLAAPSPAIDAASNFAVAQDLADLDGDGNVMETSPFDADGNPRFFDDPGTADSGRGTPPIVDMGAYEFGSGAIPGDVNGDGVVNVDDLVAVILGWGACPPLPAPCPADLDGDGDVDVDDLVTVIVNWS